MTPLDAMEALDSRLWDVWGTGVNPWIAGAKLIGGRLGLESAVAMDGVIETQAAFARVMTDEDPRRFRVAREAERSAAAPAIVLFCAGGDDRQGEDLLALSLKEGSRRFWRFSCDCDWLGDLKPDASGTLRLRQDAHGYLGSALRAAAYERRGREEAVSAFQRGLLHARQQSGLETFAQAVARPADDPGRLAYVQGLKTAIRAKTAAAERWAIAAAWPPGALILDPLAMDWTRRGAVGDAEWIEILDAPADGPLGRALRKINPRIGTKHGVRLVGQEPAAAKYQRRAA